MFIITTLCSEMKHILSVNNSIHKQEEGVKVQTQEECNECKCKALTGIHKIPRKIIRKNKSPIENNTTLAGSNAISLIKSEIYDESKKLQETSRK